MTYVFPLDLIGRDKKIAIYGAGVVGKSYYEQFKQEKYSVVLWIDKDVKKQEEHLEIRPIDALMSVPFDYIIVAVLDENVAFEIKHHLLVLGVEKEKVMWKPPQLTYEFLQEDLFLQEIYKWRVEKLGIHFKSLDTFYRELRGAYEFRCMINKYGSIERKIWYTDENKKIAYLNNKKVACSSIQASLKKLPEFDNYISLHEKTSKEGVHRLEGDYFKYTFVRNPFSRLISCYNNKYVTDKKIYGNNPDNLYFGRRNYLFGWLKDVKSFDEFIRKISIIPEAWQDGHFASQYNLIYENERCLVDYIGKFEELPQSYMHIQQKYDLDSLMVYNKSGEVRWEDYYTLELAEMVYEKYRKDIEVFGYEKECKDFLTKLQNN